MLVLANACRTFGSVVAKAFMVVSTP
jgi:hypothetical protein